MSGIIVCYAERLTNRAVVAAAVEELERTDQLLDVTLRLLSPPRSLVYPENNSEKKEINIIYFCT